MKRLLLTGGSGYLGARLRQMATGWDVAAGYHTRPFAPGRSQALALDLRDGAAVQAAVRDFRPDVIVHTACSNRSADDIAAIAPAARHLARAAAEHGARLIHVSTDLVWDGERAPYQDETPPAPLGDYGRAKAEAEAEVAALCPSAAIVRPSLIWGLDPLDRQTGWLVEGARSGRPVTLFTDEVRCPVHVGDLAAAILELAAAPEAAGPWNMGGAQALSRWDFGRRLLAALNLPAGPNVTPGLSRASGLVRARDLTMVSARAARDLKTRLRGVDEALAAGGSGL